MGIARRHVALHYRNQKRQERIKDAAEQLGAASEQVARWLENRDPSPPDAFASAELATLVRAVLVELPGDYDALLTARYLEGASVEQLAGAHRCTTVAVRSKLARARRVFREAFARYCPLPRR